MDWNENENENVLVVVHAHLLTDLITTPLQTLDSDGT